MGEIEQEILLPFLEGKSGDDAVFSPVEAIRQYKAARRTQRKTRLTPSQRARDEERAENPKKQVGKFYTADYYRRAIERGIEKANRDLPDGEKIPHWFPYMIRRRAETATELEYGLDFAQALLGHRKADMTKRYSDALLEKRDKLARERKKESAQNPFADCEN
jgi:integrase